MMPLAQMVSRETGASNRQLQWWDERGILQPDTIEKHTRLYTKEQLEQVRRLVMLRKAGVSLQEIRRRKLLTLPWVDVRSGRRPFMVGDILIVPR